MGVFNMTDMDYLVILDEILDELKEISQIIEIQRIKLNIPPNIPWSQFINYMEQIPNDPTI